MRIEAMRAALAAMLAALVIGCVSAAAEPLPVSPRLAAVRTGRMTEAAFWRRVAAEGTPLVEDVADRGGRVLGQARPTILAAAQRVGLLEGGAATVAMLAQQPAHLVSEADVNEAACTLMALGRADAALPILRWNAERFPRSATAQDGLGQAYYQLGDRARAVAAYRRSLELVPRNTSARKMIELLR